LGEYPFDNNDLNEAAVTGLAYLKAFRDRTGT
jgi:hypothetical protein